MKPVAARMWSKVDRSAGAGGCWPFTGARMRNGYGFVTAGRRGEGFVPAHRVAYADAVGPIPTGFNVLHTCDNPPCVNPAHLRIGTQSENIREMWAKGRHLRVAA